MSHSYIDGPCGIFRLPAEPQSTFEHARACCEAVFNGEYSYPRRTAELIDTAVDVGLNFGAWACWASTWFPTLSRVYGYEPNAKALELARLNVPPRLWSTGRGDLFHAAVTSRPEPIYLDVPENWGAARTQGVNMGTQVPAMRPHLLPPAHVLKIDCEGCGAEVAIHYKFWSQVRVCMYESHSAEERDVLEASCLDAGLIMVRGNPLRPDGDVRVWRRPGYER